MIRKREMCVFMAVFGLAVACVVGLAVAQDLEDEDGAIVSEEMLLEDAVSGSLDDDLDDLLLEDAGDDADVDDLLLEDIDDDAAVVDDRPAEDMSMDDLPAADAIDAMEAEAADTMDADDMPVLDEAPMEANLPADEPEKGVPVSMDAVEELAQEPIDEPIDEPNDEPIEEPIDDLPDVPEKPPAEVVAEDVPVEDVELEAGSDLDLLIEGAIDDAMSEGVPEPPPSATVAAEAEDADAAEAPVDDVADVEAPMMETPMDETAGDETVVDDVTIAELVEDGREESAPAATIEPEPAPEQMADDVMVPEAAAEDAAMTAEAEAAVAYDQALDIIGKQEELRRQALEAHGREILVEAEAAAKAHDYKEAERLFEESKRYITERPGTVNTRSRIRSGLAQNYYLWAQALQRKGETDAARELGQRALALQHARASAFLERLDREPVEVAEEEVPQVPRRRADQPDFISKQEEIAKLLRTGRQHLINGEYDRAQAKFEAVLQPRLDPENTEAIRLIQKVAQKRYDRATMELEGTRQDMMTQVRQTWNPRDYGLAEAVAKEAETVTPVDKKEEGIRDRIRLKMEQIKIPEVDFRQANIHDVVEFLQMASVDFDPAEGPDDEKGVNIILSLGESGRSSPAEPAASDDPFGSMLQESNTAPASEVPLITFTARYISLLEALRIVTQVADLKYRIEGSVVMIVPFDAAEGDIVVRMYDVLPAVEEKISIVGSELGGAGDRDAGGDFIALEGSGVQAGGADWKAFFGDMGVEWPNRSSIKYVRTIGKIVVANTEKNLAVFEKVLEVLNVVPSQIEIEARFVEVTQTDLDSLGFEWLLDNTWQVAQKKGQGNLPPSARQRIEVSSPDASGRLTAGNRYVPTGLDGASDAVDSVLKIGSVLTNPELSMVLHMLQQRGHADLLSAPKVTTKSGNEATIKVVTEYIYPTEFEIKSLSNLGGGGDSQIILPEGVSPFAAEPSIFETREVGVILSVLPEVSTEGQMINLNMTPKVVSEPTWHDYGLMFGDIRVPMEQPFFHTRSVNTSISIYNGATVVMGGMITEERTDVNDRVPLLGNIPLVGRLFRSSYEHSEKRNLLIFVTARMVDPNGLPINQQEEVPLPDGMVPAGM